jgi:hypothetical protein
LTNFDLQVSGTLDKTSYSFETYVSQINKNEIYQVEPFWGNLKDGLTIDFQIEDTEIRFSLRRGVEVYVSWDGKEKKILSL